MKMKMIAALFAALFWLMAAASPALALEGAELARVDAFLNLLGTQSGIQFVRNGSKYPATRAVKHLRTKLSRAKDKIQTAEEFVEHVASSSSISGKPYQVILPDGSTVLASEYFKELLKESDKGR